MTTTFITFDIESTGAHILENKISAVGICVADGKGNILEKKKFKFAVEWPSHSQYRFQRLLSTNENKEAQTPVKPESYGDFEPRCWDEFWHTKTSEFIAEMKRDTMPQKEGFEALRDYIDGLEEKYPKMKILSNNTVFDIAYLNYYLAFYAKRRPLNYSSKGKYRGDRNVDNMLDMFPEDFIKVETDRLKERFPHDHDPVNDAIHIYRTFVLSQYLKKRLEESDFMRMLRLEQQLRKTSIISPDI
jgi:hypothetical protein